MSNLFTSVRDSIITKLQADATLGTLMTNGTWDLYGGTLISHTPDLSNCPYIGIFLDDMEIVQATADSDTEKYSLKFVLGVNKQDLDDIEELYNAVRAVLKAQRATWLALSSATQVPFTEEYTRAQWGRTAAKLPVFTVTFTYRVWIRRV